MFGGRSFLGLGTLLTGAKVYALHTSLDNFSRINILVEV